MSNTQDQSGEQILVVDDTPASLKLLTEILTEGGYRVRPASSGRLALRSAAAEVPDLILLDVLMPDIDGYEVCTRLKRDQKTQNVPIIFISSLDQTVDRVKGFQAGGIDFISKPFQPEEILARVRTHLSIRDLQKQLESQNAALEREVIERKQKEDELKRYQENLEDIVRSRTEELDQFFALNLDLLSIVSKDGRFIRLNPEWEHTLGYPVDELKGKKFIDYVHPDDQQETQLLSSQANNQRISGFVNRYRHKDGTYRWVEWFSVPFRDTVYASARDITERMNAAQALESARKKLNLLNWVVFEDIKNYVFSLAGYIDLHNELTVDEQQSRYISNEKTIVGKIVESLNFARLYQDMGMKPPVWHNVCQTFLYAISHLDLSHLTREMQVDDLEVYADPLLETVFFTLAENVLRYAPQATRIRLYHQMTPEGFTLFFEDNGPGIKPEVKEEIFERWYGERKGMGLFLSREILAITGFSIQECGEIGTGARLAIRIPEGCYRFTPKEGSMSASSGSSSI